MGKCCTGEASAIWTGVSAHVLLFSSLSITCGSCTVHQQLKSLLVDSVNISVMLCYVEAGVGQCCMVRGLSMSTAARACTCGCCTVQLQLKPSLVTAKSSESWSWSWLPDLLSRTYSCLELLMGAVVLSDS